jgi:hypothetical protein
LSLNWSGSVLAAGKQAGAIFRERITGMSNVMMAISLA